MTPAMLIHHFASLNVWTQGDIRVPHKPLLLLFALANAQQSKPRLMPFHEIESKLEEIITAFGPNRSPQPEYPFWHLKSEEIWDIPLNYTVPTKSGSAGRKYLRDNQIQGGFTDEVYALLKLNPGLIEQAAIHLLEDNFPSTLHQDILDMIGLGIDVSSYQLTE